jgi:6-phosphofructokinase 1
MARTSTKALRGGVMGRHAGLDRGWRTRAAKAGDSPHIILFPEITFDEDKFCARVKECVERYGYCAVVVSEGVRNAEGKFLADAGTRDAFGHAQLGGVAPVVAQLVKSRLGYKYHWAVADYLQRAAAYRVEGRRRAGLRRRRGGWRSRSRATTR